MNKLCEYESSTGKCTLNECMYYPVTNKDKYNLCESVRKSLDDTTTDCEDCKARIRAEAIDECIDTIMQTNIKIAIKNPYTDEIACICKNEIKRILIKLKEKLDE